MASTLTHVTSSDFFPRHRVQKLLSRALYSGLTTSIKAEGVFIQVAENGFPVRQVFLAVTEREILIVKQDIPEVSHAVSFASDTEISDLSVDQILPLPAIRFLILDDRTKCFSICSNSGTRFRFEMCQLDRQSEQLWVRWRDAIIKLGGGCDSDDVNTWRTSYVIDLSHGYDKCSELTKVKVKSPVKSIGFESGQTVGNQTESELTTKGGCPNQDTSAPGDTMNKNFTRPKKYVYAQPKHIKNNNSDTKEKGNETVTNSDSDSSSSSEYLSEDETLIGYRPSDRLTILFTAAKFVPSNDNIGILRSRLRESKSMNDLQDTQCQPCDMSCTDPSFLKKLSRVRKNVLSCKNTSSYMELESSSESEDEDLDKLFEEAENKIEHNKANDRSGRELWDRVKELLVQKGKTNVVERFQDLVHQAHFRTLSYRVKALAQSVTEFDPLDVSAQLTNISRKLFLALSLSDLNVFTRSRGGEIRQALRRILKFSEDICKMVTTEVIKFDSRPGCVRVLTFFVQVAVHLLFRHHDFQSLMAVLRGLTSLPLYRMGNKWATFFVQEPFPFCHFLTMIQLLNPKMGYAAYVSRVNTCMKRKSSFIPLIDHILEHCLKRSYHMNETLNLLYMRQDKEKTKDSTSIRSLFGSNKKFKNSNDKKTALNGSDKNMKEAKSVSIMSVLHFVRRDSETSQSPPDKKDSKNKNQTDFSLKSILVNKEKTRNSFTNMFFQGKKKKHRVTFELDSDTREAKVKERSNVLLKHLTKTRVKHTDVPYGEDKEVKTDSRDSEDDKDIKMFGDKSIDKLSNFDNRLSLSPALLSFCDFKAKTILESAFREIRDMEECDDMSVDSERESSEESDSILEDTHQYSQIKNENEVNVSTTSGAVVHQKENTNTIDKTYAEEDKTDVDRKDESSSPVLQADKYTSELDISDSTSGAVIHHEEVRSRHQEEDKTDVDRKEKSTSSLPLTEKYTLELDSSSSSFSEDDESTDETEIGQISSATLWQVLEDEMSNTKETVSEDVDASSEQEVSSKTKKKIKGKVKQKLSKLRKRTPFLQTLKRKFGRSKKAEVKHINALQKDIDDIANLMSSFKTFDDEKENEGATNGRSEREDSDDIETRIMLPETHRRKSYVPSIVERGRRKSMFEEAISANTEEEELNQAELFESLKNKRLDRLKKRGSIALGLLTPDEDDSDKVNNPDPVIKDSKVSLIDSFTNLFRSKNASNNSAFEKVDRKLVEESKKFKQKNRKKPCSVTYSQMECHSLTGGRSSQQFGVSINKNQKNNNRNANSGIINAFSSNVIQTIAYKDVSFARHGSDQIGCSLCDGKVCLYECGIGNFVTNVQKGLANIRTPSRQRVKECLSSIITINNYLTNFDILQLSLYSE